MKYVDVVIAGPQGSGKTQLIEAIASKFSTMTLRYSPLFYQDAIETFIQACQKLEINIIIFEELPQDQLLMIQNIIENARANGLNAGVIYVIQK